MFAPIRFSAAVLISAMYLASCSQSGSGGSTGGGGNPNPAPPEGNHQDANGWVQVNVPSNGPYPPTRFNLPASQNWANTGLYLRAGQTASISAQGTWSVTGGELYNADGEPNSEMRGCQLGELVARIDLSYEDTALTCIGQSGQITAHKDGIVYVGAIASTDLGESYESRRNGIGALEVSIISQGQTVPTVTTEMLPYFDYAQIGSGWVELRSPYHILTLPTATAIKDKAKLKAAITRLDDIYLNHKKLRLAVPHNGQPIRWLADAGAPGWMLAGNPIRMDPALIDSNSPHRITLAAEPGNGDWGFAHELGHDFNFVNGDWYYTMSTAGLEVWPNIFSVYAQESLNLPKRELDCEVKSLNYKATGSYEADFKTDVWLGLCFLLEFSDTYGWEFYQRFYQEFNTSPIAGWYLLKERFSAAADEDVTPIFDEWKIPYNP